MKRFWIWRRDATPTQQIGAYTITPVVQSLGLRWPHGGWLWQFPLAVEVVEEESGEQQRLPIADPTRTVVWFLYTLLLLLIAATVLSLWLGRKRKQQGKKKG